MTNTRRSAFSSLLVSDDARLLRAMTSAIYLDIGTAARAAELSEPPERGIEWLPAILDNEGWLLGIAVDHSPSASAAPYLGARLVHPGSATEDEIRRIWSQVRRSALFLTDLNEVRAERGLVQAPTPRFDTQPAPSPTYDLG
ncbi:hypothetical protein [Gordonia hongkongensis]|uniref:hypothetical protein n=1 Tax=Gordonia hongkongensis TaxID=1701090 RepID=UPI003D7368E5